MVLKHSTAKAVFEDRKAVLARGFTAKNYSIALHDHDFYEINIVLSGKGVHFIEDKNFRAVPGDVFVIPPMVTHGYTGDSGGFDVYHLILRQEFFEKYSFEISHFDGFSLLFEIEPYLRIRNNRSFLHLEYDELGDLIPILRYISALAESKSDCADVLRNVWALSVIGSLSRRIGCSTSRNDNRDDAFVAISSSLEYIHSNLSEKLTVERLSVLSNMSRSTFLRKFFEICNTTPSKYITQKRITKAKELISRGYSKTFVAQECGFYDLSHMEKCIKSID